MKKYLCILVLLIFTGMAAIAQPALINSTHSNIRNQGVMASYTAAGGLVLTFDPKLMDASDKKALATGFFVVKEDITFTAAECKALKISSGIITKGKGPITKRNGKDTCKPGYTIKIGGAEHKNDWPQK